MQQQTANFQEPIRLLEGELANMQRFIDARLPSVNHLRQRFTSAEDFHQKVISPPSVINYHVNFM
jgi:hypothetical protein